MRIDFILLYTTVIEVNKIESFFLRSAAEVQESEQRVSEDFIQFARQSLAQIETSPSGSSCYRRLRRFLFFLTVIYAVRSFVRLLYANSDVANFRVRR